MLKYSLLLLTLFSVLSCEEFLDRQPLDQLVAESFYQTEDDLTRGVLAAYNPLQDQDWTGKGWMITEIPTDNSQPGGSDPEHTPIDNFTVNADNPPVAGYWRIHYRTVALANVILDKTPLSQIAGTPTAAAIMGEARFLRALAYFDLVRIYGGVPLMTVAPTYDGELLKPRSTVAEVYELIVADLTDAAATLPTTRSGSELGRATKGSALGLLAKVQLTRKDFAAARDAAKACIDLGVYQLMPNFGDNFELATSDNNAESVFQVQFFGCGPFGTGNPLQAFFAPWGQGITKDRDGWGSQIPTAPNLNGPGTTIVNAFTTGDLRKAATLMTPNTYYPTINAGDGGYTYPSMGASATNANIKKYVVGAGSSICFMSTPMNFHVIRYADVLLSLAEAYVELGGGATVNADALAAFNAVRVRAGLAPVTFIDRETLFTERRLEFAFEGQRWFDLLRQGITLERMRVHGKVISDHNLLFPLPSAELRINTNLTQNPGY